MKDHYRKGRETTFYVVNFMYVHFECRVRECEQNVNWKVSPRNVFVKFPHAIVGHGAWNPTINSFVQKL